MRGAKFSRNSLPWSQLESADRSGVFSTRAPETWENAWPLAASRAQMPPPKNHGIEKFKLFFRHLINGSAWAPLPEPHLTRSSAMPFP
jgi:hypothetical protein